MPMPPVAEFPEDFIVGVVGQARGQACWPAAARPASGPPSSRESPSVDETTGAGESGRALASRSRPRKLSEESSATRRRQSGSASRCAFDRLGRELVELAQAVGVQGLVGRVQGWMGVHGIGLRVESELRVAQPPGTITKALVTNGNER